MEKNTEKNEKQLLKVTCRGCGKEWQITVPNQTAVHDFIAWGACPTCSVGLDIVDLSEA